MATCKNYKTDNGDTWVVGGKLKVTGIVTGLEGSLPEGGTAGNFLKKTADGSEWAALPTTPDAGASTKGLVKQGVAVADAASTAPTAAEFKALLDSLRDAGIIATATE